MAKKYPIVVNQAKDGKEAEILLYGPVGKSIWDNEGITGKDVTNAIKEIPKGQKITIGVNSQGGAVHEGMAIYNAIARRSDDITVRIDGYALSIASVFPLAASKVVSPKSSVWMIHNASNWCQGTAKEMRKNADMLETHDGVIVDTYAAKTGKTEKEIRASMDAETWMTGEQAIAWGLADEESDNEPVLNSLDFSCANAQTFEAMPENFSVILASAGFKPSLAAVGKGAVKTPVAQATQNQIIMNKQEMLDLLKMHSITPPDNATDDEIKALVKKLPAAKATPAPAVAIGDNTVIAAQLNAVLVQLEAEKKTRITKEVNQYVDECRIPAAQVETWVARAMKDEQILKDLAAMPQNKPGADPLLATLQVSQGFESPLAELKHKFPKVIERVAAMKKDWPALYEDACKRDSRRGSAPMNSNTYSGTLVTSFLMDGSLTDLQNILAPLGAFSIDYTPDPYKPLASGVLKHVTAGATAQTDATNFESGDSTVAPITVTMHQYTVSFQVSNSDLNSGLRMENLVKINSANFGNKVIEVATVPLTTVNFDATSRIGTPSLVSTAAAFGYNELSILQGSLKKSPIKNLLLDGSYIARIANQPGYFQQAGTLGSNTNAWKIFGWDFLANLTDWTGAGANVQGFACNPQAVVGIAGLPLTPPNIPGGILSQSSFVVPGLETSVAMYQWFNTSTRTMWWSYDIMLGVAAGDKTAGTLVTSA